MERLDRSITSDHFKSDMCIDGMLRDRLYDARWHNLRAPWIALFHGLGFTRFAGAIWEELS